MIQVSWHCV